MRNVDVLMEARRDPGRRPAALPVPVPDAAAAYALQQAVLEHLGDGIGGWKVGFTPATGVFTCAPLPAGFVRQGPVTVPQAECPDRGVEAEIAVVIGADLPPRGAAYSEEEILAAIGSAHPAIELLQSRFADVETVAPMSNLGDSLSHFGLVYGPAIADWQSVDLAAESVRLVVDGLEVKRRTGNPAGALLPLVTWLASTGARWAGGLKAGQVVTTGSWTGKDFVPLGAHVVVSFEHCGQVDVTYG